MPQDLDNNPGAKSLREEAAFKLAAAHNEMAAARAEHSKLSGASSQADREFAERKVATAQDKIDDALTIFVTADLMDVEAQVRSFERASFDSASGLLRAANESVSEIARKLNGLLAERPAGPEQMKAQAEQINALGTALQGMARNAEAAARVTEGNAEKEKAMQPPVTPGVPKTQERPPGGGGGKPEGGGGGGANAINISITFAAAMATADAMAIADAQAKAAANAVAQATAKAKALLEQAARQARRPAVALSVRIRKPQNGETLNEGGSYSIEWETLGGTAPRTAQVDLYSTRITLVGLVGSPFPHVHELISGQADTGVYVWNPVTGYASGTVGTSDLPGYYIKVTVTDASGAQASDAVPIILHHP